MKWRFITSVLLRDTDIAMEQPWTALVCTVSGQCPAVPGVISVVVKHMCPRCCYECWCLVYICRYSQQSSIGLSVCSCHSFSKTHIRALKRNTLSNIPGSLKCKNTCSTRHEFEYFEYLFLESYKANSIYINNNITINYIMYDSGQTAEPIKAVNSWFI